MFLRNVSGVAAASTALAALNCSCKNDECPWLLTQVKKLRPAMFKQVACQGKLDAAAGHTAATQAVAQAKYSVEEKTIAQLAADMASGCVTSERLVEIYLSRIEEIDKSGPSLRSIICVNPQAVEDARKLDEERATAGARGILHGIPILVKDNIETADNMPTTAGSLALTANMTGRDAPLVAKLRAAGAVILGKTNLSEWANIRSSCSSSGWSAVGGLTLNPYALDRSALGSSSGSGAAIAANLAAAAVGTETDGSVTCPAAAAGLVGVKPTVGLVSRRHVVPISHSQDTAGPMARSVEDAACLLGIMAGVDPKDEATWDAEVHRANYVAHLDELALRGARIGVARFMSAGWDSTVKQVFEAALDQLQNAGAELVEINDFAPMEEIGKKEFTILMCELKTDLNTYLAGAASDVVTRSLADVIAFNDRKADLELLYFGQELFLAAEATKGIDSDDYQEARKFCRLRAGPEGIDHLLRSNNLRALVAPTMGPAYMIDLIYGDPSVGAATTLPAAAGYPHVTVPMGEVFGLPVGLSIIGPAWDEQNLLSLAYAFEKRVQARRPPTFAQHLPPLSSL